MTTPNRDTISPADDEKWMQRALDIAQLGQGHVEPNPMVGCVIVKNNQCLGQGYHEKFGQPHAEINALRDCQQNHNDPSGSDIYVTLEPCAHHGKTPPCADALIAARPARVICAMIDPFEHVAGRGLEKLRGAGIRVDLIASEKIQLAARELVAPFLTRVEKHRPYIIAKWAQTLDGRIATAAGHSQWISNEPSRAIVHQTRARVDAIIVGIGTALADNPTLTARLPHPHTPHTSRTPSTPSPPRTAQRIVIDPLLKLPTHAKLLNDQGPPVIIACADLDDTRARASQYNATATVTHLPFIDNTHQRLDLRPLFQQLATDHDMTNVLVEGGGKLIASLFAQQLIDETLVFIAPIILGDPQAIPAIDFTNTSTPFPQTIDAATQLQLVETTQLETNTLLRYRPPPRFPPRD